MAKSGFVPAWMKIPSSDKSNGNQKLTIDRTESNSTSPPFISGRQRHHSSDRFDHTTTRHRSFFSTKPLGRNKCTDFDGPTDGVSRRSYSRERLAETNGNGYRPSNHSQRRLHSVSSYSHDQPLSNTGFDRLEQDFPSLNGREKNNSSSHDPSSSVWTNAATKLRTSHTESYKYLDRSLSNNSRTLTSNRLLARRDRLLSTPNGGSSLSNRLMPVDLQTNYKTQTKNLDKRSDFFNSLKTDSTNEGTKRSSAKITSKSNGNYKTSKATLLLLSVPETPEEKELLIQMGWKDCDEMTYEITDQDKEEYEKRIQLLPKTDHTSATLMSALHRRALPCIDIEDLLRFEMINSTTTSSSSSSSSSASDDDVSDE